MIPMARFDSTNWTVVLGAAAGNPSDRDALCRRYESVIRAYLAARWRVPFDSDQITDCTQEVFLQLFRADGALGRVDPSRPSGFRGYLYGVTNRTAVIMERNLARKRRDHAIPGFDPDRIEQSEATLSAVFDKAWAEMLGLEARELVSRQAQKSSVAAKRQRCLELRFVRGMPPRDIAPLLDVEVERVYEMLNLAKKEYRAALLTVMSSYHPDLTEKELEEKCSELAALL